MLSVNVPIAGRISLSGGQLLTTPLRTLAKP